MKKQSTPAPDPTIVQSGLNTELLKALHILTRDGAINQDSRRKLKQVMHLVQFIRPLVDDALAQQSRVHVVDHGAGKSYLGFVLYNLFSPELVKASQTLQVTGVEVRDELVQRSRELAAQFGLKGMEFMSMSVAGADDAFAAQGKSVDIVTALHACDTATDDAISFALRHGAQHLALVPCCQAEVAATLRGSKAMSMHKTPLAELWRRPLHTREFGSQITNVLRCLRLEAHGYKVTATELVGWEHSMKNELIIASRHPDVPAKTAAKKLQALLDEIGLAELRERFAAPDS
ncbi:MAG: hypothetical protein RL758_1346 [Pseudomonadota bacterium]